MNLDEQIKEIKNVYNIAYKEKCDTCKYQVFSKKMQEMNISQETVYVILDEIEKQSNFDLNRWTKVFKVIPSLVPGIIISYVLTWIDSQFKNDSNFWNGFIVLVVICTTLFFLFGSIASSLTINLDIKRHKKELFVRLLEKYINDLEYKKINS